MSSSSSSSLNLNPVHTDLIGDFLKLTHYQQIQRVKSIDHCFKNTLSRLRDDEVYTGDEVTSMITALQDTIISEVENELKDSSHTNVLLLQQLLGNAEQWRLTLAVNIAELEDREKLNTIKQYENQLLRQPEKMSIVVTESKQMIPVQDMSIASALKIEIENLKDENEDLQKKLRNLDAENSELKTIVEQKQLQMEQEVARLSEQLEASKSELENFGKSNPAQNQNQQLESVQNAIENMSLELEQSRQLASQETEKLRQDLECRESKLRQIQSTLLLTEKELDKKFQATVAYTNMKKILEQKNNVIKNMRKKLIEVGIDDDTLSMLSRRGSGSSKSGFPPAVPGEEHK